MTFLRQLYANRWVRYALTLLLLGLVSVKIQPQHLSRAISSAQPGNLALALILTVPFLYLKTLRWHLMLRSADVAATFREAAVSLVGGMGLALVTPARLGELVRVAYLRDPRKLKIGGLVMLDKGFDVLVLAALSIAGAWALLGPTLATGLATMTVIGLGIVYYPEPFSTALHKVSARTPVQSRLDRVWGSLEALGPGSTTIFLLLTLCAFAVVLLQFGIILLSWKAWSPSVVFLTFPLVILTNVLPITIGGLGVREGVAALLLGHYGVSPADAALAAFLMFVINTAIPGMVGAMLLPTSPSVVESTTLQPLDRP